MKLWLYEALPVKLGDAKFIIEPDFVLCGVGGMSNTSRFLTRVWRFDYLLKYKNWPPLPQNPTDLFYMFSSIGLA